MNFTDRIIKLSYRLENSHRYRRIKTFFNDLLENPKSPLRFPFDIAMITLVISSIAVLIYGVKNHLGLAGQLFEIFVVSVFLLEYLLRMWVYSDIHSSIIEHFEQAEFLDQPFRPGNAFKEIAIKKWEYMKQPMAIIDLLAILPTYRPIRLFRIFLIFRLFKLLRYTNSLNQFTNVLTEKRFELFTLGMFISFVIFAASAAIYIFEVDAKNTQIHTLYDAFYWSLVTISTVGYGDITPQTSQGRAVAIMLIVVGIGVIAFFTSIIVSAFTEKLPEINKQRIFNELEHHPQHTIVCGYGRLGQNVAEHLKNNKERVVVIDIDAGQIALAKQRGILALRGDAESNELLENLNIKQAKRILCLTDNDISNVYITLSSRQSQPDIEIIAKANSTQNKIKLTRAGANHTIAPYETAGLIAAQYAGQPVAFEAFFGLLTENNPITVDAMRLHEGSDLIGQETGAIDFKQHKLILFGIAAETEHNIDNIDKSDISQASYQMEKAHFHFNPSPSFPLIKNDVLIVFGHKYSIARFRESHGLFKNI